jgi:hypothetical protein
MESAALEAVVVPDPDNERGVRVVNKQTGELIATGHLEVGPLAPPGIDSFIGGASIQTGVRFVGETVKAED